MIKTETVFILGAGASNPFGYPIGTGLADAILNDNTYEKDVVSALNIYRGDSDKPFREEVTKFKEAFSKAGTYTIDSFLAEREIPQPELVDLGKTIIAKILISYERDNNLRVNEKNWYKFLFNHMKTSFEELNQNKISFITFNYDRSLEYYLFEAIRNLFSSEPLDNVVKMMKNFPIVHLYGKLDPLPWQGQHGEEYSATKNLINRLRAAKTNIQLIGGRQDIGESKNFEDAYRLLGKAGHIFFLGFGFDETNLERLQVKYMNGKKIWGTQLGVVGADLRRMQSHFSKRSVDISLHNLDNLSLLQQYLEFE